MSTPYHASISTVKWEQLVKLGRGLPDVGFLVDSIEEQQMLIAAQPELYFITDHYRGFAAVLAHLSKLRAPEARRRLTEAWFKKADGIERARRADVSEKRGRVRTRAARKK